MEKTMYHDFLGNGQPQEVEIRAGPRQLHHFFPWQVVKTLTEDDVKPGSACLELSPKQACDCMFKHWHQNKVARVKNHAGIVLFIMYDMDTETEHTLSLTKNYRGVCEVYLMHSGWMGGFVRRRGLAAGMKIGMYWDARSNYLKFSVLD